MGGIFEIVGATADLGITTAKLADEAVNESKLHVSNAPKTVTSCQHSLIMQAV